MSVNRRTFLKSAAFFGAGLFLPQSILPKRNWLKSVRLADAAVPTLDPTLVPKYSTELVRPPTIPMHSTLIDSQGEPIDYYEIAIQQFQQDILPTGYRPKTTVWSYAVPGKPETQNYPSFTIEATYRRPVRVKWINDLVDSSGNFLPHLLAVDPTLHWANPGGPRDTRPTFTTAPSAYTGPVPLITHVHGAHVGEESDGYPEAWFLPQAKNLPANFFRTGSFYDSLSSKANAKFGQAWEPGSSTHQYPNDQRATTLWYHDHALGITRLNVYAGPAGFYLLRGGPDDLPAGLLPPAPYEVAVVIQDRAFNDDGSLFYPDSRDYFDKVNGVNPADYGGEIDYIPDTDISPIWNPEFFGNVMVVNGKSWPKMTVEKRRYRLRLLNGCNSRTLILKIVANPTDRPATSSLPFWQIGTEGGFLQSPVERTALLLAPAERADVIIDFSNLPVGASLYLINEAADMPFQGGVTGVDYQPADPQTTGQVMRFDVIAATGTDSTLQPYNLPLPAIQHIGKEIRTRKISLNELRSDVIFDSAQNSYGPREAQLGGVSPDGMGMPMMWADPVTESPGVGDTEIWEIHNYTEDAHPIHVHLVMFEVVNREFVEGHAIVPPETWERGFKDTVIAYPEMITRIKATFDLPGRYVWHCHILEHEDNEMMRPYDVLFHEVLPLITKG